MMLEKESLPESGDDGLKFLDDFTARMGRPLRVLHIGNIANNAYNNAKIQRLHGIEADVLCYDYYHVMGTPEWEDAEINVQLDPFLPDWWSTNLYGFRRPDWFVQGPAPLCILYLIARSRGHKYLAMLRRWRLEAAYSSLLEDKAELKGKVRFHPIRSFSMARRTLLTIWHRWMSKPDPWLSLSQRFWSLRASLRDRVFLPLLIATTAEPPLIPGGAILIAAWRWERRKRNASSVFERSAFLSGLVEADVLANFSLIRIMCSLGLLVFSAILEIIFYLLLLPVRLISDGGVAAAVPLGERKIRAEWLIAEVQKQEPNVSEADWQCLRERLINHALVFDPVLSHYDIVQGYSVDGIIPLACGIHAFSAYEHGTLRDIPFETTLLGLTCRVVYRNAPSIFITNSDVLGTIDRLSLDREKICYLPHAFNDTKLDDFRVNNPSIAPDRDIVHFFCPSRQHWRDQNPSLTKGSDLMLKAAAAVAAEGHAFRLVLVEWGVDIEASKELIRDFKLESFVSWVPPMAKKMLWQKYCASHAVLDQFSLPALGGVGFETLALGRRLITRIDSDQLQLFFGCAPPVLPATDVSEIAASMRTVILDPDDAAGTGAAGRDWIKRYHSARRIVDLQAQAYGRMLEQKLETLVF